MLTPQELDEYLDVLREKGATAFSCPEFAVTLGPEPQADADDLPIGEAIRQAQRQDNLPSVARGIFGHPSLWPNGKPPTFPGAERATVQSKPTHPDDEE